jgi:hypothetical protein|nr:MAG TPA: Protein of unknown function (DUF1351) [Caudoviricetes sp.]
MQEIILLKQEPIIEYNLLSEVGEVIQARIADLNLDGQVVTDQTVKSVKDMRAELNKEFAEFEKQRKFIKEAVSKPYQEFEAKYKEFVAKHYNEADDTLKGKIFSFENTLRLEREKELQGYFMELCSAKNIDFVPFRLMHLNITLSASLKSLKTQILEFVSKVEQDIELAKTVSDSQEFNDKVMYEYRRSLDINTAINTVKEREQALIAAKERAEEEAKRKAEQEEQARLQAEKASTEQPTAAEPLKAPMVEEQQPTNTDTAEEFEMTFTVKGTFEQLKALKQFIVDNNIKIME